MRYIMFAAIFTTLVSAADAQQSFVTVAPEPKHYDWWLRAEFHPFHKEVRGIPVGKIHKGWCKATEFTKDLFPSEVIFEGGRDVMADSRLSFAVEGSFDGSKVRQTAIVGVYESCAGGKGNFLLILDQSRSGPQAIRFIQAGESTPSFVALAVLPDASILVVNCMGCDEAAARLQWDKSKRRFVWLQPKDDN
jgi:hypothetical protein